MNKNFDLIFLENLNSSDNCNDCKEFIMRMKLFNKYKSILKNTDNFDDKEFKKQYNQIYYELLRKNKTKCKEYKNKKYIQEFKIEPVKICMNKSENIVEF